MGSLVRVIRPIVNRLEMRPDDIASLPTAFYCFFPLGAAVQRGLVKYVGSPPIPKSDAEFPVFRSGNVNPMTKKVDKWWLWNGRSTWQVNTLTDEQRRLSIRAIWNDTLLRERLEQGWLPENDGR